jgi:hypothetical protein
MSETNHDAVDKSKPGGLEIGIMACIFAAGLAIGVQFLNGKVAEVHMEVASVAMKVAPSEHTPIDYTNAIKISHGEEFASALLVPTEEKISLVCAKDAEGSVLPLILAAERAGIVDTGLDMKPLFEEMEGDVTQFCKDLIDIHA